jgi:hypothetical protein
MTTSILGDSPVVEQLAAASTYAGRAAVAAKLLSNRSPSKEGSKDGSALCARSCTLPAITPLFTRVRRRISMKMSSRGAVLKGGSITQHRPHDVDPPTRQSDEGLGVPLALGPLALVEGPGRGGAA